MKLYGTLIAKNEGDIIEQTLLSLKKYGQFEKIFFYDNGSSDDTLKIAKKFDDFVICSDISSTPYSDDLKYKLLNSKSHLYAEDDWLAVLDADELYVEPIMDVIESATRSNANCIEEACAQFYMCEKDEASLFNPSVSAFEQRKYYLINYGEPRVFKYSKVRPLSERFVKDRDKALVLAQEKLLIAHFQYRSSGQMQNRINVRKANDATSGNWGHVKSDAWQDYLVKSEYLHKFDGKFKQGLPAGANLYKIDNNPAYTNSSLRWLLKNKLLTKKQEEYFEAGKLKKLYEKLF